MSDERAFDVTIVILTADRTAQLRRLLDAVNAQARQPKEILIIDNSEGGETSDWFAAASLPGVQLVAGSPDSDFAQARNQAVAVATSEWIAFIDDDCVPAGQWLRRAGQLATDCDAMGGPVLAMKALPDGEWFDADMGWAVGLSTPGAFGVEAGRSVLPQTANMFVRREILLAVPFEGASGARFSDGELARYAGGREDADLWLRLRERGLRTRFDCALCVLHDIDPGRFDPDYIRERARQDGRSAASRSRCPAPILSAVDDIARGWLWRADEAPHVAFWRERQRSYLATLRDLGDTRLSGLGLALRQFGSLGRQSVASVKRHARSAFIPEKHAPTPSVDDVHHLVVAAETFIGDMVILAPLLAWARQGLSKDATLTLLTDERGRSLVERLPVADRIETDPSTFGSICRRADMVVVPYWQGSPRSLFQTGVPVVTFDDEVGFPRRLWYERATDRITRRAGSNEVVNLARLFASLGIEGPPSRLEWPDDVETAGKADLLLKESFVADDSLLIGVHMDATHRAKEWPWERWKEALDRVADRVPGARFVLTGSADSRVRVEQFRSSLTAPAVNLCGLDDLRVFPELARRMRLFASTDSGPRHLAAAVGCPTVTVYGWTDPRRWGAFFEPDKHIAVCVGDSLMTADEIEGREHLAIGRVAPDAVCRSMLKLLAD